MSTQLQQKIKSLVIIPGTGEFVYSPKIVYDRSSKPLNAYSGNNKSNVVLTIEKFKQDFPNLKNVSLVVGWFADSLDAEYINIVPKAESKIKASEAWSVAGYTKDNTYLVSRVNGEMSWGGTPSDQSIIEVCELLKNQGYNVTLYPMLFIDLPDKPWRGFIKASSDIGIENFFEQYENFILHYATLEYKDKKLSDTLDSIIIGSEFRDLLKYKNQAGNFIAVDKLIDLAKKVKIIVGDDLELSYAANWDEYHHTDDGWYHLDSLWASPDISFIGINAYFPLTDNLPQKEINYRIIKDGWKGGEHYDYIKDIAGNKKPIEAKWAIKNINYWWKSYHYNPDGKMTLWRPQMKPIIFTEFGFPSIDGCTNQPNAYIDLNKPDSTIPKGSEGKVDYNAQQVAIEATLDFWEEGSKEGNSENIVPKLFLYGVDARHNFEKHPEIYKDAQNYNYGHWVKVPDNICYEGNLQFLASGIIIIIVVIYFLIKGCIRNK